MPRSFLHKNWRYAPRGDFESMCSVCGVACARSKLRRRADALYYCPDCQPGRDAVTLSRLNAAGIPRLRDRAPLDGGGIDSKGPYSPIVPPDAVLGFLIGDDGAILIGDDAYQLASSESNA